jgi:hypothetical protein
MDKKKLNTLLSRIDNILIHQNDENDLSGYIFNEIISMGKDIEWIYDRNSGTLSKEFTDIYMKVIDFLEKTHIDTHRINEIYCDFAKDIYREKLQDFCKGDKALEDKIFDETKDTLVACLLKGDTVEDILKKYKN